MLPTCKQVAEQSSEDIDEPLTGIKWLKMKVHLLICAYCRRYRNQMELSSQTVNELEQKNTPSEELTQNIEECYRETYCNSTESREEPK